MMLQSLRNLSIATKWAETGGFAEKQVHFLLMIGLDGEPKRTPQGSLDCWFSLTTPKGSKNTLTLGKSYTDRPETSRKNQNHVGADCFVGRADRLVLAFGHDSPFGKCCRETIRFARESADCSEQVMAVHRFYELLASKPLELAELSQSLVAALIPYQPKARLGKKPKLKLPKDQEIAFCVTNADYQPVFDLACVRGLWGKRYHTVATSEDSTGVCLCCGSACSPVKIHMRVIKGLPGKGIKGVSLMSYNKASTQSHGLKDCQNAPMCPGCVDAYTIALNNLLKNRPPKHGEPPYGGSERLAGLAFVYWFRDPVSIRPVDRIINGVQHIEKRLESLQTGSDRSVSQRANRFYLAVMSAPTLGRAVLHDWLEQPLEQIDANLDSWFDDTQIIDRFTGGLSTGLRFAEPAKGLKGVAWAEIMDRHIPSALGREISDRDKIRERGMRWDLQKDDVLAIFERALLGKALPLSVMHLALARLQEGIHDTKEKKRSALPGFTIARLGLMRAVLNDHRELLWERKAIMPGLERDRGDPAYVCGRLLALLSRIQAKAIAGRGADDEKEQKLSANVVSRYYGAASSRPATGLYLPLRMRIHHLAKLDRDDPGAAVNLRKEMQEAFNLISVDILPKVLSPAQQCVFALGFEHQMAQFYKPRKKPGTPSAEEAVQKTSEGSK